MADEEERRIAAEQIIENMQPVWVIEETVEKEETEMEVVKRLTVWDTVQRKKKLAMGEMNDDDNIDMSGGSSNGNDEDSTQIVTIMNDTEGERSPETGDMIHSSSTPSYLSSVTATSSPISEDPRVVEERKIRKEINQEKSLKNVIAGK